MKIGFLITARLKSTRLPQKLLLDLNGKPIVERVIDRCKKVADVSEIILCTSTNTQDKPLTDIALKNGIHYYLGSEMDVLQRLSDSADFFGLDYIINITGENPLFSMYHANLVVNQAKKEKNDFIYLEGLPIGCAVYGLRPEALKTVCEIKEEIDTEIWGPLINRPEIFNVKAIKVKNEISLPELRITIDYIEDFLFVQKLFSFFPANYTPSYLEILNLLTQEPNLKEIHSMHTQASLDTGIQKKIDDFFLKNKSQIKAIKTANYQ